MIGNGKVRSGIVFLGFLLAGCVAQTSSSDRPVPLTLELEALSDQQLAVTYRLREPTRALHYARELGGYRGELWHTAQRGFRWVTEGDGEWIERIDGEPFDRLAFTVRMDYRPLPKSYAPFSPFSDGSTLFHSGQFHACLHAPCDGTAPLPTTIDAPDATMV